MAEVTFYNWKKKIGGLGITEIHLLKKLEDGNAFLKQILADLTLDKKILQDIKKMLEDICTQVLCTKTQRLM